LYIKAKTHAAMKRMMPRRSATPPRRALAALALILFSACHLPTPAGAVTIELKDAAPDRIERQRQVARGVPLEGTPEITALDARLSKLELKRGAPVMLRIFKEESQLELWMMKGDRYIKFAAYPICHWSGSLGPKLAEGDKQSPEGFYTITRRQLHYSGRWPRSLNIGFPNAFDRSLLRTGSYILIHGGCSSVGCYAMTNPVISEVFGLVRKALQAGQDHIPVHVFPFRMTEENLNKHEQSDWIGFWRNLRAGYDSFERTRRPPRISVCRGAYQVSDAGPGEVGQATRPLNVCGETAQILEAEQLLQKIVSRPSRWQTLSDAEKKLLALLTTPPDEILRLRKEAAARASSYVTVGKKGRGVRRRPRVTVTCDLRRVSCRRFLNLKRKRIINRHAKKRRGENRRRRASKRR
jgi:murein L,D-transpeptidase YafK